MKEQKTVKLYRVLKKNGVFDFENPQEIVVSEKDYKNVKLVKSGEMLLFNEFEFEKAKKENPGSLKAEIEALKAELKSVKGTKTIDEMTKAEILQYAKDNDIEIDESWSKKELIEYLKK